MCRESESSDEGIETAPSCDSREVLTLTGGRHKRTTGSVHRTIGKNGYDVPVSMRSKMPIEKRFSGPDLLIRESVGKERAGGSGAGNSPPPTYSQLFRNSTSSNATSTCTVDETLCTHKHLHDLREGETTDETSREEGAAGEAEGGSTKQTVNYVSTAAFFPFPLPDADAERSFALHACGRRWTTDASLLSEYFSFHSFSKTQDTA